MLDSFASSVLTIAECDVSRRTFVQMTAGSLAASLIPAAADDLTRLSLVEASALVRARKVSPVELTQACLARIELKGV